MRKLEVGGQDGTSAPPSSQLTKRLDLLEGALTTRLAVIERNAVLRLHKIPGADELKFVSQMTEQLKGKDVLCKLDLDLPLADNADTIGHFKIDRAVGTLKEVVSAANGICILAGQGISSQTYIESINRPSGVLPAMDAVLKRLNIQKDVFYAKSVDDGLRARSSHRIVVLPNLAELSNRELLFPSQVNAMGIQAPTAAPMIADLTGQYPVFLYDDFRSIAKATVSNVGLAAGRFSLLGDGFEKDITALEQLIKDCIHFGSRYQQDRICICGSSRPYDLHAVRVMLERSIFDSVCLGAIPGLIYLRAMGKDIPVAMLRKIEFLENAHGVDIDRLNKTVIPYVLSQFPNRIHMPLDYRVVRGGKVEDVLAADIGLARDAIDVVGVGQATVDALKKTVDNAALVFHFGMLGSAKRDVFDGNEQIMRRYAAAPCKTFVAGDHLCAIARRLGLEQKIDFLMTGASTTAKFLAGDEMPGLEPFFKQQRGA